MGNMSYCRFENTVSDMRDCVEALEESSYDLDSMMSEASSEQEAYNMKHFVQLCKEVAENFDDEEE